jgi:eukaryotic-like serine/threonine-protein kinase
MKKFQLSRQYRLTTPQDVADGDSSLITQLKQGEFYGLLDTASGECVLINDTMHLFLKTYQTPKTLEEVATVLAADFDCPLHEVLPIAQRFFKEMKERGVLLAPKAVAETEIIEPYPNGTLIDHYRIEDNLSVNLPLEVYKATNTHTEQTVILKLLRIPTHLSPKRRKEWRKEFKKEFKIQKILRGYPSICQLLSLTPEYAVLEWIDGISLRRRLANGENLGAASRDALLSQLFDTYSFMHKNRILHSDVHTSNVLVTADGSIKIIDFDLAHQLSKNGKSPTLSGGAPEFIPPENVRFDAFNIVKGKANYRTEVYQLGVIAYFAIYGKMPFEGDTWQDLATNIINSSLQYGPLSISGEEVSPEMIVFLQKCLAKKPKNRFASAKAMHKSFQKIRANRHNSYQN